MQDEIVSLARQDIVAMSAYRSARSEGIAGSIWLDANENPWEDAPYNRYPEPQPTQLTSKLSALYSVTPEQLLVTRGSDEGIDLLVRLFCHAGQDNIMTCPPTYGMYKVAATIQGAGVVAVPLVREKNFSLDVSAMVNAWKPSIKLIFLCSPNNPTGNLLKTSNIVSLCQQLLGKAMIVVDEAYIEFSMDEGMVKYLSELPNLIVLRTLSKAYGLAGIRCGTTLANPYIIELLKKIIAPYPVSKSIVDIACQKLHFNNVGSQLQIILQEKAILSDYLSRLTFVKKIWESRANFLLVEVSDEKKVLKVCLDHGIILRDRSSEYNLTNCIRITIGTPIENKTLMEALSNVY